MLLAAGARRRDDEPFIGEQSRGPRGLIGGVLPENTAIAMLRATPPDQDVTPRRASAHFICTIGRKFHSARDSRRRAAATRWKTSILLFLVAAAIYHYDAANTPLLNLSTSISRLIFGMPRALYRLFRFYQPVTEAATRIGRLISRRAADAEHFEARGLRVSGRFRGMTMSYFQSAVMISARSALRWRFRMMSR